MKYFKKSAKNLHLLNALFCLLISACSTLAQKSTTVKSLKPNQRIIVGEVSIQSDNIKKEAGGLTLANIQLMIGTKDQLGFQDQGLSRVDCNMTRTGCSFSVAYSNQDIYIHSIRTDALTLWVHNAKLFPLYSKITSSKSKCEYVGSYKVSINKNIVRYQILDNFNNLKKSNFEGPKDCEITKNLAQIIPSSSFLEIERKQEKIYRKKQKEIPKNSI